MKTIEYLSQLLQNNIDQKLTAELATGIATLVNQQILSEEKAQDRQPFSELTPNETAAQ